jgi:hypothetical protein
MIHTHGQPCYCLTSLSSLYSVPRCTSTELYEHQTDNLRERLGSPFVSLGIDGKDIPGRLRLRHTYMEPIMEPTKEQIAALLAHRADRDEDYARALAAGQVSLLMMEPLPLRPPVVRKIDPEQAARDEKAFARIMGKTEGRTSAHTFLANSLGVGRPRENLRRIQRGL